MEEVEDSNFKLLRDCFASPLIEKSAKGPSEKSKKGRGNGRKKSTIKTSAVAPQEPDDAEELAEFIDVSVTDLKL